MAGSFYIIDGHAQIFRAYYARLPELTSPRGEPTKAVHVFLQFLLNLIRDKRPDYLVMAMDTSDETVFRRDLYPDYKANREPPPADFEPQANRIVELVEAVGIPILRKPGFEADDLMATLCRRAEPLDLELFLVSKDKDMEQLLDGRVRLYDPGKDEVFDAARLVATKGYPPGKAIEVQTLSGDTVDNIPGVKGIGPATAAKLIIKYGSAQAVIEHAHELTPKMKENVLAFAPYLEVTRRLVTLKNDVEFDFDLEQGRFRPDRLRRALPILEALGMSRLRGQVGDLAAALGVVEVQNEVKRTDSGVPGSADTLFKLDIESTESIDLPYSEVSSPVVSTVSSLDYRMVDTPALFELFLAELADQPSFAFDTETTHINPVQAKLVGLSFSWQPGIAYYIPVRGPTDRLIPESQVIERLGPFLTRHGTLKVGQNLKYDLVVLRQLGLRVEGPFFDTMIAAFLLEPLRRSHGIDAMTLDYFGHAKISTSDLIGRGRAQVTMAEVDPARVCEYACEDADYAWRLKQLFEPRIQPHPCYPLFRDTEMPLVEVLAEMEHNGVAIDTAVLARMSNQLADRLHELARTIHRHVGYEFNIDSTQQLARVLFDEQGLTVVKKTKTGRSTDAETLEALAHESDNPIPKLVLEYRELVKLKNTYVDTLPEMVCERTGRIHTGFNQTGAVTGRLSSSDPNLQNIPIRTELGRHIRTAFVADSPERFLLVADYSQIELRILAHFCKDPALVAAFEADQDIHSSVAAQVYGVAIDQVTKEQRSAAKAVNFGIIYGQTAFGLARSLGIGRGEAESFIRMYFLRYPGIRTFIDRCILAAKRMGYVETILGRRRPLPELKSPNKQIYNFGERIAVNTVIQGSAADLIKKAMIDIHGLYVAGPLQSRMLIQVHDELVFETPKDRVEAEADMIREKMTQAIPFDVPIRVDVGWGQNWLESK